MSPKQQLAQRLENMTAHAEKQAHRITRLTAANKALVEALECCADAIAGAAEAKFDLSLSRALETAKIALAPKTTHPK